MTKITKDDAIKMGKEIKSVLCKTNASTAAEAREQMIKALEAAGFDFSNVTFSNVELRDSDGSTFDRIEE